MTTGLTRTAPDGATEYLCPTFGAYYRAVETQPGAHWIWCACMICDTMRQPLVAGAKAQQHCYPMEANDAHLDD